MICYGTFKRERKTKSFTGTISTLLRRYLNGEITEIEYFEMLQKILKERNKK